jgi:hypothetical protein
MVLLAFTIVLIVLFYVFIFIHNIYDLKKKGPPC